MKIGPVTDSLRNQQGKMKNDKAPKQMEGTREAIHLRRKKRFPAPLPRSARGARFSVLAFPGEDHRIPQLRFWRPAPEKNQEILRFFGLGSISISGCFSMSMTCGRVLVNFDGHQRAQGRDLRVFCFSILIDTRHLKDRLSNKNTRSSGSILDQQKKTADAPPTA